MTQEQVQKLIAEENEERLQATLQAARTLIARIAQLQKQKLEADVEIKEAREELRQLTASTLDTAQIIGGF